MPSCPSERAVANLNRALATLLDEDEDVYVLGEDIVDPYGGAFKATRGLSDAYRERVLSTPISEGALAGVAGGLALRGRKPVIEVMFSDFVTLCFDQILNFASKSVTMYGSRIPMRMVVRCPSGGNRGYGPTHSQSLQKHFLGIPNLAVFELSPFHDNTTVFRRMLELGHPCMFFEDKVLYTRRMFGGEEGDSLFESGFVDAEENFAWAGLGGPEVDHLVIAPGGLSDRVLRAMRAAFIDEEATTRLVVPSQLYPLDIEPLVPLLTATGQVWIAEDCVAGGTWGADLAHQIHSRLWTSLSGPVRLLHPECKVIPASSHLERQLLLQADDIRDVLTGVAGV
ncbi:alpha-ketoacid dehydrogenase subunit beta [Peterkaempfera griseoplana]|uniref:alpha-ketoacid dehydrogenase subunit beta n=1 Tax=Peterkaempfera griseoplana TaxID=66896 RepID=UPI0006E32CCE|nr:transketolase C-terminal domain-containing protein [Peterkaempfera griseoplana]